MANNRNTVDKRTEWIYQVKVPLPFPLRWVNAYVVKGDDGYSIIDPGLHTADAIECWDEAMKQISMAYSDIRQIVLTHHHPDHYGLAGWFQRHSQAPVWISEAGKRQADYLWGKSRLATEELPALFIHHGMESNIGLTIMEHMESFVDLVSPQPATSAIPNEFILIGNQNFQPIHTPGHAYGHMCFFDQVSGRLFCGDHVLPQITPNIGLLPGVDDNPLRSFVDSLQHISTLDVTDAYPGHREPFTGFKERCHELISHHNDRLNQFISMVDQPRSAYELCLNFFGSRLSIHQLRFAMAETLAHLVFLRESGRLIEMERDNVIYFCRAD
jgi:glyoxylase-like metal-dependent hydrolase (beta-lactamase superfamily II)